MNGPSAGLYHCASCGRDTLQQLLRFLRSTPSSTNVQPNHFYILATDESKERLATNLGERFQDNAEKILNASHTIILTTRADLPHSHLEAVFAKERADGRFPDPAKQALWESMTRDFLNLRNYGYKDLNHWMEKQTYMAVGLTMMAAAELGVEATPLEGFDPTSVDKAFKIRETGHTTTVLLALGYPDPNKQYSNPISRFDADQLFTLHLDTHGTRAAAVPDMAGGRTGTPFTARNGLISP